MYDGQYMANSSAVVVVTINYRLGAMGFLVYRKGEEGPAGNFGLRVCASVCLFICLLFCTCSDVQFRICHQFIIINFVTNSCVRAARLNVSVVRAASVSDSSVQHL